MSDDPSAEKFNIVSNDHECTQKGDFSVFDRKYHSKSQNCHWNLIPKVIRNAESNGDVHFFRFSWTNLVQKFKIVSLSWYLTCRLIPTCRFQFVIVSPRKVPWNWIAFYQNPFVLSPGQLYHLIRRDTGRLANEAFTANPIVPSKQ